MAEWFNLTDRTPEPGQAVLVKADDWRIPRVLEFDLKAGHPRLIDRMSGRFFWYPERMRWAPLPPDGVTDTRDARPLGCALAMRIMQSELYQQLDETERADCDELVQQNLEWFKRDSAVGAPGCECTRPMVPVGRTCLKCGGIADGVGGSDAAR